jgi:hypothetical protein
VWEVRECPPPMSGKSMVAPLGGGAESPGAPTTYVRDVDGRPSGPLGGSDSNYDLKVCSGLHG